MNFSIYLLPTIIFNEAFIIDFVYKYLCSAPKLLAFIH